MSHSPSNWGAQGDILFPNGKLMAGLMYIQTGPTTYEAWDGSVSVEVTSSGSAIQDGVDPDIKATVLDFLGDSPTSVNPLSVILVDTDGEPYNASGGGGGGTYNTPGSNGASGGGGGGTTVYKQIQYTQTSVAQARSMLVSVLTEALGRYPTDGEVQRFLELLNKAENKSPTKTVTRTTTEGDNTTAVSRTTPSGVDAQAMAEEFARTVQGGKPFEERAVDRYLNALLNSMGERRA